MSDLTTTVVKKEKVCVLFSGGADSTLLLKFAEAMYKEAYCVLIDYGQLHVEELKYAEDYCVKNNIQFKKVSLCGYDVKSGLTTGDKGLYENVHVSNVPARNTIMLGIAAGVSEAEGIDNIWYGADYSDREGLFPDCFQEFVFHINKVFAIAFNKPIKVYAPLMGFSKQMVLDMLELQYGIKAEELYTGYREFA